MNVSLQRRRDHCLTKCPIDTLPVSSTIGNRTCGCGGMADALGSGPSGSNPLEVQVLSSVLISSEYETRMVHLGG